KRKKALKILGKKITEKIKKHGIDAKKEIKKLIEEIIRENNAPNTTNISRGIVNINKENLIQGSNIIITKVSNEDKLQLLNKPEVNLFINAVNVEIENQSEKREDLSTPMSREIHTDLNELMRKVLPVGKTINITRLKQDLHQIGHIVVSFVVDGRVDHTATLLRVTTNKINNKIIVNYDRLFWQTQSYITISLTGKRKIQKYLHQTNQYCTASHLKAIEYISSRISNNKFKNNDILDDYFLRDETDKKSLMNSLQIMGNNQGRNNLRLKKVFNSLKQAKLVANFQSVKGSWVAEWNLKELDMHQHPNFKRRSESLKVS
ncbi:MAG: hypothetical protein OXF30_01280, partial [Candidatus Saccharibacteria bacterium]|nr:hypothetical protein [Candidatus Saccharibacteria bacterium]